MIHYSPSSPAPAPYEVTLPQRTQRKAGLTTESTLSDVSRWPSSSRRSSVIPRGGGSDGASQTTAAREDRRGLSPSPRSRCLMAEHRTQQSSNLNAVSAFISILAILQRALITKIFNYARNLQAFKHRSILNKLFQSMARSSISQYASHQLI